MHRWIARDSYYECTACGLEAGDAAFTEGAYPMSCTRSDAVCRFPAEDGSEQTHHLVAVPAGPDEEPHAECYHCARQF